MKAIVIIFVSILLTGACSKKEITDNEFKVIWQEYLKREFEESFDEKQSTAQREKILTAVLKDFKIEKEDFMVYMKKEQELKYKEIFLK